MICPGCIHYRAVGTKQPIAPACAWRPTAEQLEQLRAILPAPALSRALAQAAPHQVEACGAIAEGVGVRVDSGSADHPTNGSCTVACNGV